ncbi:MAG: UvrD-helicase domain-containing protein [Bacteroidia bacterium]|nr:UvrD-helicase domain-containing protein [Bacteroidia bacterium]
MSKNELVIYRSSAGSGKTYTLVMEYLKLVLKRPSLYRSVLAITFTNKATEEMKTRIVDALVKIARNSDPKFIEEVQIATGIPIQELPEKSRKVLNNILHDYSGFAISTIDSFFSGLIRSLARELHLPLRFDLELNIDKVIDEITTLLLDDVGSDEWLGKWLREFIMHQLDEEKGWRIESHIKRIARVLFDEKYRSIFQNQSPAITSGFITSLKEIKSKFENQIHQETTRFLQVLEANNLTVEEFSYGKSGAAGFFLKLHNYPEPKDYQPGARFLKALAEPSSWATKKSPRAKEITQLAESDLNPIGENIQTIISEQFTMYKSAHCVLINAYMSGILGALDQRLRNFRDEHDLVLISDTNQMLNKVISNEDAPFIYEKTGNRFTHFMLDEFQDTSDFQWRNLMPLITNALGSGNYAMLVGDAKQSIYRWRGGNMQLLLDGVQKNLKSFEEITRIENLESNFRSNEVIVNFNNQFFQNAPSRLPFPDPVKVTQAYNEKDVAQKWKKGVPGDGFISINFFKDTSEKVDTETGEMTSADKWKIQACEGTVTTIHKLFETGFEPGDIAILVRQNSDAKEITQFLIENGIDRIISPESMQLNHSAKIQFLINIFKFINDRTNAIALTYAVYYLRVLAAKSEITSLHELFAASSSEKIAFLPQAFRNRLMEFRKLPLYELSEEITDIFGLNTSPDAYLQRFLDVILDYIRSNPPDIANFLEWWEENENKDSCSVIIPSGENAIRVMSIHKSKGLQFPIVIMPFADWDLKPSKDLMMWVSSDVPPFNEAPAHPVRFSGLLENSVFDADYQNELNANYIDNLNLLYVAFTRAEKQLYVFSKKPGDKINSTNRTGIFLMEVLGTFGTLNNWNHEDTKSVFTVGAFQPKLSVATSARDTSTPIKQWISIPWKSRIKMGISKKKISIYDPESPDTAYGILFHDLLSKLTHEKNIRLKVTDFIQDSVTDPDIAARILRESEYFIEMGMGNNWFDESYEIVNEAELLLEDGSILRPDRLMIKDKQVIIIDYKTGNEERHHTDQVKQYAAVLSKMGYNDIKIFLIYTSLQKLKEVKAA